MNPLIGFLGPPFCVFNTHFIFTVCPYVCVYNVCFCFYICGDLNECIGVDIHMYRRQSSA